MDAQGWDDRVCVLEIVTGISTPGIRAQLCEGSCLVIPT